MRDKVFGIIFYVAMMAALMTMDTTGATQTVRQGFMNWVDPDRSAELAEFVEVAEAAAAKFHMFLVDYTAECGMWEDTSECSLDGGTCHTCPSDADIPVLCESCSSTCATPETESWDMDLVKKNFEWIDLNKNIEGNTGLEAEEGREVWRRLHRVAQVDPLLSDLIDGMHASVNIHICMSPTRNKSQITRRREVIREHYSKVVTVFRTVLEGIQKSGSSASEPCEWDQSTCCFCQSPEWRDLHEKTGATLSEAEPYEILPERRAKILEALRQMDEMINCVPCEACRIHGKLQVRGLWAALAPLDQWASREYYHYRAAMIHSAKKVGQSIKWVADGEIF